MDQLRVKSEKVLCGAVFVLYTLVTTHKLTNAPLWFDETIEYWYSKVMFGSIPFNGCEAVNTTNMYQRIVSTFQPPLYNVIMHFWLKLGDSEWWFRFFGVVMGFIGMIAVYKTISKISNAFLASLAVMFSTCIYQLAYFWQECAEYSLMLSTLFWTIYFWFCLIEEPSRKTIIVFTISAIIPVYSQYGAAFPVAVMAVSALIYVILLKDTKKSITIIVSDIVALVGAALPLYYFFLRKQLLNQQETEAALREISFSGGLFRDMLHNLQIVFKWNFFSNYSDISATILLVVFCVMIVSVTILSRNKSIRLFFVINMIVWLFYYFSVKSGIYAYGSFGNRYNLFFIPMWILMGFAMSSELFKILPDKIKWQYVGLGVCFILCFSYYGWTSKLQDNWSKENCRKAVEAWYAADAAASNTIVYYAADSGFAYYVRQNSEYTDTTEDHVIYMDWYRDMSMDEYREFVDSLYGADKSWPDEIYVVASHTRGDLDTFLSAIMSVGYDREDIYSSGAYLIRLTRGTERNSLISSTQIFQETKFSICFNQIEYFIDRINNNH